MPNKVITTTTLAYYDTEKKKVNATKTEVQAVADDLTALDTKVDGIIAEGGEPNVIETVKVNGIALTPDANKAVDVIVVTEEEIETIFNDMATDYEFQSAEDVQRAIDAAVSSAFTYKGSVATESALPASGNKTGDVYDVQDTGMNYAWNGTAWDALGGTVDLSNYWDKTNYTIATAADIDAILNS